MIIHRTLTFRESRVALLILYFLSESLLLIIELGRSAFLPLLFLLGYVCDFVGILIVLTNRRLRRHLAGAFFMRHTLGLLGKRMHTWARR